jgi:hypothetical protein
METVDVKSYLALMPSLAQQRIVVSLLGAIAGSKSFLEAKFGLSPTRQSLSAR